MVSLLSCLAAAPASALAGTEVRRYDPFTAHDRLKDHLRAEYLGNAGGCFRSGLLLRAFACPAGLDPCFEDLRRRRLICASRPWSRKVFSVRYDSLDRRAYIKKNYPFGLVLRSGRRCQFIHGATTSVGGRRLNYGCYPRRRFLFGFPDRRPRFWTIRQARDGDGRDMRKVQVKVAWM